jgi:hypothetical protein
MDVATVEVVPCGFVVLFRREPGESLVIDIQSQWVGSCQQHVYSEIELQLID